MRLLDAGCVGDGASHAAVSVADLSVCDLWGETITLLCPSGRLRPVQASAFAEFGIHQSRRNLVVSAPTNSGKSLIGHVVLLDAVRRGGRGVLIEPLRALAQEKADELAALATGLPARFVPTAPRVTIATGDYRIEHERFEDAPPSGGELIVCTPERLEAILRCTSNDVWLSSISAVVVDEAHLIGSARRGPTLEYLIALLRTLPRPPRLALLSATIGQPETLSAWLAPCDLITQQVRTPPLRKEICVLGPDETKDQVSTELVNGILDNPTASVLVFVYTRASCRAQATSLNAKLVACDRTPSALPYSSAMSSAEKASVRAAFLSGDCRVVVTTTALALGVNLPATHVIVRDTTFHGVGRLEPDELLQMLGRAGRGDTPGRGILLLQPGDEWDAESLVEALRSEAISPIRSAFEGGREPSGWSSASLENQAARAGGIVGSVLSRTNADGASRERMARILEGMLAGQKLAGLLPDALSWLEDGHLAYHDDSDRWHLTRLGDKATRSVLPLSHAAGAGQLLRDLLDVDPEDALLSRWSTLDDLIVADLLSDRGPNLRRFSEPMAEQVDGWMEGRATGEHSVLFAQWICGRAGFSKADELLGSLDIHQDPTRARNDDWPRQRAYRAAFRSIVLDELSKGTPLSDLERGWRIEGLAGLQEDWRDGALWLLTGQVALYDIACFYYHLRVTCGADDERVHIVKRTLRGMQRQGYELIERLKYCSPLGPLLRGVRGMLRDSHDPKVGVATLRRLEQAGINSLAQVARMSLPDLVSLGVRRSFAKQILTYVRRRSL